MALAANLSRHLFGRSALQRWACTLDEQPAEPLAWSTRSIALASVVRWDDWPGQLSIESPLENGRLSTTIGRIASTQRLETCTINLVDLVGFGASKGPLAQLRDLRSLAERLEPEKLVATEANLARLLQHDEIRVSVNGGMRSDDCFHRFGWEPGYWISNSGGSHHLAAAAVVAQQIGATVHLSAPLYDHQINQAALAAFSAEWQSFLFPIDHLGQLYQALADDGVQFVITDAPRPFLDHYVLHLSRKQRRARASTGLMMHRLDDFTEAARAAFTYQAQISSGYS